MKIKYLAICIGLLFFGSSCSKEKAIGEVFIRIENTSSFDFTKTIINMTSDNPINYGDILMGQTSEYKVYDFATNVPEFEVVINDERYILTYNDLLGYNELDAGSYTFRMSAYSNNGVNIILDIVEIRKE